MLIGYLIVLASALPLAGLVIYWKIRYGDRHPSPDDCCCDESLRQIITREDIDLIEEPAPTMHIRTHPTAVFVARGRRIILN